MDASNSVKIQYIFNIYTDSFNLVQVILQRKHANHLNCELFLQFLSLMDASIQSIFNIHRESFKLLWLIASKSLDFFSFHVSPLIKLGDKCVCSHWNLKLMNFQALNLPYAHSNPSPDTFSSNIAHTCISCNTYNSKALAHRFGCLHAKICATQLICEILPRW
jgi:hypothetical protein